MNEDQLNRFWDKVNKGGKGGCWNWTAVTHKGGYGKFGIGGRMCAAHRISKALSLGLEHPDDIDLHCLHRCDNSCCVNPDHIFLGTNQDNVKDRQSKGRQARGEKVGGSKLTESQVLEIRRLYKSGNYTQYNLADIFGVRTGQVHKIIKRIQWNHI